jgi:hypothetical protein
MSFIKFAIEEFDFEDWVAFLLLIALCSFPIWVPILVLCFFD